MLRKKKHLWIFFLCIAEVRFRNNVTCMKHAQLKKTADNNNYMHRSVRTLLFITSITLRSIPKEND